MIVTKSVKTRNCRKLNMTTKPFEGAIFVPFNKAWLFIPIYDLLDFRQVFLFPALQHNQYYVIRF